MSPGILSDKRAIVAVIIGIPLAIIAIVFVRPIDYNLSLAVFGAALALFLFAYLLDVSDEVQKVPAKPAALKTKTKQAPKAKPAKKIETEVPADHAEVYIPEVTKPAAEPSKLPIETIEGIGSVHGKRLRNAGYQTVADMIVADAERIAKICNVSAQQAERWIAMSRFAWLDEICEEDAEAIVFVGYTDLEGLAKAQANDLYVKVKEAIASGRVRVPAEYNLTLERVRSWIDAAKRMS